MYIKTIPLEERDSKKKFLKEEVDNLLKSIDFSGGTFKNWVDFWEKSDENLEYYHEILKLLSDYLGNDSG